MNIKRLGRILAPSAFFCAAAGAQVDAGSLLIGYGSSPAAPGGVEVIDHQGNRQAISGLSSYVQDVLFVLAEPWSGNIVIYANGFPYPTRVVLSGLQSTSMQRLASLRNLGNPTGFVVGRSLGEFFFAVPAGIYQISAASVTPTLLASLNSPQGLAIHGDQLYTVCASATGQDDLQVVDIATGSAASVPVVAGALIGYAGRLAVEPSGDVAFTTTVGLMRYEVASRQYVQLAIFPPYVPGSLVDIAAHRARNELATLAAPGLPGGELSQVWGGTRAIAPFTLASTVSSLAYMATPPGMARTYGQGCPGGGGFVPHLTTSGAPRLGASFAIGVDQTFGGAGSVLFLGLSDRYLAGQAPVLPLDLTPLGFGGCALLQSAEVSLAITQGGAGAGNGSASISFTIPSFAPLVGASGYAQWAVFDGASPNGALAMSGLAEIVIG